ncbi:protein inturned-like [Daphnia carinata]|uniref:protein inturned-like n=1 Tax=Daphnia carinata TaxID=120202 RepID=UPI0025804B8F|nr:protein inturned-like [Daphnia carinata]
MESYRHSGSGSSDSSSRYQQLPTRSDPVQHAVASSSGVILPPGTRNPGLLLAGARGSSSSSSGTSSDYSDSCSSSDCSSTSSWSSESIPVWESHIDNQGELFYVEFSSNLQVPTTTTDTAPRQPCSEDRQEVLKKKKKKKNRLSRLLKRRAVGNNSNNKDGVSGNEMAHCESPGVYLPTEAHRSPADDWSDWTSFTLELEVHPTSGADGSSLSGSTGRRNKGPNHLCETLLGFVPGVTQSVDWHGEVSLRQRVIVDKLTPGGPLHQGFAHVQQGDWLEKLNGQNVTHRDLNDILSSINSREIVELNFRRRPTSSHSRNQETNSSGGSELSPPHGIFLLSQENVTEASAETADILYQSTTNATMASGVMNPLLKWRGALVTLAHLMPQLTGSAPPSCSTVILDGMVVHLVYIVEGSVLFLIGAPSIWCSHIELQMMAKQLASLLQFQYGSIRRALTEPRWADEIRRMVDTLFHWLQFGDGGGNRSAGNGSSVSPGGSDMSRPFNRLSNYFVTCGQWLPLPPESHLDVTLTLNQMEAIDYEDWDEEAITIQRCATITGSAVYCQGYLVASTMAGKRLEEIGTFLKWNQILEMSHRRRLSSLIIWREVFLADCDGNRSFLVVVGSGHILLVAQLESGGVSQSWDNYPDTFLIEEMQFFLEELQYLDLETSCNQVLNGPQNPALVTNLSQIAESTSPISSSPESDMPTFRYLRCLISRSTPSWRLSSITPGSRPTMINYLSLDFGTGVFIAPTLLNAATKFTEQFQKTALTIHNLFQRTLKAKVDLQRPDWGGPWSDKSLVALQEVSVVFTVAESPPTPSSGTKSTSASECFWVTGRLFLSPVHRELYVCHQDGVAQDILDLAFHLAFGAVL